ncbi:MAG: hypothetical protein ACTSQJ_14010 [Promethearchaeota archaeon]
MEIKDISFKNYRILRITGIFVCIIGLILILFFQIKTTENFRILSDFIQNIILFVLVLLIFLPDNKTMKVALIIGVFTMLFDFIIETIAVYLDWWYPLGGTQMPPIIVIPIEMVLSFLIIGTTMAIVFTFPEKIREMDFQPLNWIKPLFENENYDWYWRVLLIFINAIIGTYGDYNAGQEIWIPGPNWHPIYTFFVWFFGGIMMLLMFWFLQKKIKR